MPETPITFEDVEVLGVSSLTLKCRVQGTMVTVGRPQVLSGSTVTNVGDRGRLVLPRWAVQDLGLIEPAA
jgi:hypothetical protein